MAQSDDWKVLRYRKDLSDMEKGVLEAPNAPEARMPKTSATPKGYGTGERMYDLQQYKKGGKVAKTGKAKVHKGEYVIKKAAADKLGPKKLASLNQANRDKKILQKTRFR